MLHRMISVIVGEAGCVRTQITRCREPGQRRLDVEKATGHTYTYLVEYSFIPNLSLSCLGRNAAAWVEKATVGAV